MRKLSDSSQRRSGLYLKHKLDKWAHVSQVDGKYTVHRLSATGAALVLLLLLLLLHSPPFYTCTAESMATSGDRIDPLLHTYWACSLGIGRLSRDCRRVSYPRCHDNRSLFVPMR